MIPFFIHEIFDEAARIFPEDIYIYERNIKLTYSDFVKYGNSITSLFQDRFSISRGDHVLYLNPPSFLLYLVLYACSKVGAVLVPLNPNFRGERFASLLSQSGTKLIVSDKFSSKNYNVVSSKYLHTAMEKASYQSVCVDGNMIDLDPLIIFLTSGSTGTPKGIVHSHSSVICATESIDRYLNVKSTDTIINFLPPFFDYGFYQGLICANRGASVILGENLIFFNSVVNVIKEKNVSIIPFVPTQTRLFVSHCKGMTFSGVKKITNTGASFPIDILNDIQSILPNAKIFSMYGLTECKRTTYLRPEKFQTKPYSVGKSIPNCRIFLVGKDGEIIDKPNIEGQLVIEGRNIMNNYCFTDIDKNNTDPQKIKIENDGQKKLLYSGDYFKYDNDYDLIFIGRKDDLVKIDDYRVSLKDIENIIRSVDNVIDAAVVKAEWNNKDLIVAYCISKDLTEKAICQEIGKLVESRQLIPSYLFIVPSFPLTGNQKVDYTKMTLSAYNDIKAKNLVEPTN